MTCFLSRQFHSLPEPSGKWQSRLLGKSQIALGIHHDLDFSLRDISLTTLTHGPSLYTKHKLVTGGTLHGARCLLSFSLLCWPRSYYDPSGQEKRGKNLSALSIFHPRYATQSMSSSSSHQSPSMLTATRFPHPQAFWLDGRRSFPTTLPARRCVTPHDESDQKLQNFGYL